MNVLFYTSYEVSPLKGGTERITATIAEELQNRYNINCFSIYSSSIQANFQRTHFVESQKIPQNESFESFFQEFIQRNSIDIVINQGAFGLAPRMRNVLYKFENKYLILVHHFNPGAEEHFFNLHNVIWQLRKGNQIVKNSFKLLLFPIISRYKKYKLRELYHEAYESSDRVVLLSKEFLLEFMRYAKVNDCSKFRFIHNCLSFNTFYDIHDYQKKEKEVLVVSRLDEVQKRISLILKIWKQIESIPSLGDWRLTIVGHGEEYEMSYKNFVKRNNLQRVQFVGANSPEPYYRRASLLPLTSSFEGWGLTLTEAQQFGVVPIAFYSYASLTDIISNGENGFIIPNNDINAFTKKIVSLMENDELRKTMAYKAIQTSHRFSKEKICEEWMSVFYDIK